MEEKKIAGISAKDMEHRPKFQEMLKDLNNAKGLIRDELIKR